jgi:hypothetical protein
LQHVPAGDIARFIIADTGVDNYLTLWGFDDQRVDVAVQGSGGSYEVAVGAEGYWPVTTGKVELAVTG